MRTYKHVYNGTYDLSMLNARFIKTWAMYVLRFTYVKNIAFYYHYFPLILINDGEDNGNVVVLECEIQWRIYR